MLLVAVLFFREAIIDDNMGYTAAGMLLCVPAGAGFLMRRTAACYPRQGGYYPRRFMLMLGMSGAVVVSSLLFLLG